MKRTGKGMLFVLYFAWLIVFNLGIGWIIGFCLNALLHYFFSNIPMLDWWWQMLIGYGILLISGVHD